MKGQAPSYIVNTAVEVEGGKTRWREIGVAFANAEKDTVTILLDALPVSGKLVLMRPKPREKSAE
jgi:hypothetical protein